MSTSLKFQLTILPVCISEIKGSLEISLYRIENF